MPIDKDFKRRVRGRMQKTGEAYTAARAQLLGQTTRKKGRPARATRPTADLEKLAGMSDQAVRAKTGRGWQDWTDTLDRAGAAEMPHRDIAELLSTKHGVPDWWSQMVTVGYERIRGLREIGQRREGGYEAGKSKTFPVTVDQLYAAFAEGRLRRRWLDGAKPKVSKATPHKSVRMVWEDGSRVEVYLVAKGAKSQVAIQHRKLGSRADVERLKTYWGERLAALAELFAER